MKPNVFGASFCNAHSVHVPRPWAGSSGCGPTPVSLGSLLGVRDWVPQRGGSDQLGAPLPQQASIVPVHGFVGSDSVSHLARNLEAEDSTRQV